MLTLFIFKHVATELISPALGFEAIVILLSGFVMNDRLFRYTGLAVLCILTGKLLVVDFSKFNTIERVISFIVAGLVFLLSSYGYARFTRSFEDVSEPAESSPEEPESINQLKTI